MSARSVMVLVTRLAGSEPLLLVESGSSVAASARATLSREPVVGAVTVTVQMGRASWGGSGLAGEVTTPPASDPASLAERNVTPAGRGSGAATAGASEGPLLVTVMV